MPLRDGSLTSLAQSPSLPFDHDQLCAIVLEQMLSALDYLACEKLIHRDLKPDNILYSCQGEGRYLFQLADFGVAHHRDLATTRCGTGYYQAPELWPTISKVVAGQSPNLDIWSLFASIIAVRSRFRKFPPNTSDYSVVLGALRAEALANPRLEPMARLHPDRRASAAQMLDLLFDGKGLTTPRSKIPPVEPDVPLNAGPSSQTKNNGNMALQRPTAAASPLVVYPRRRTPPQGNPFTRLPQPAASPLQPIRAHRDGVVKRLAEARARGNSLAKTPSEQKSRVIGPPPVQDSLALPEFRPRIPGAFDWDG